MLAVPSRVQILERGTCQLFFIFLTCYFICFLIVLIIISDFSIFFEFMENGRFSKNHNLPSGVDLGRRQYTSLIRT